MDFIVKTYIFFCLHRYLKLDNAFYFFYFVTYAKKNIVRNAKGDFLKILFKLNIDLMALSVCFQIMNKDVSFKV